jgi:crossover junction endodeoxyribonuclease RuvC
MKARQRHDENGGGAVARMTKRIIGIDTSLRATGIGVVEMEGSRMRAIESATLRMPASYSHSQCLHGIWEGINGMLDRTNPSFAAVEGAFFAKNAGTAMILGQARGVAIVTCANRGLPVFEYAPRRVKQALTGYGTASKEQVAGMVARLLGLKSIPGDDETDALALAICHLNSYSGVSAAMMKPI